MINSYPENFLYRLLTPQEKHAAALHLWERCPSAMRKEIGRALASRLGFRPMFVNSRPKDWVAGQLVKQLDDPHLESGRKMLHQNHLLLTASSMIAEILDAEGTLHEGPMIAADAVPPTEKAFLKGIRHVTGRFPDREVCLYYDTCLRSGAHFAALGEVIQCDELKSAFERLCHLHPDIAQEVARIPKVLADAASASKRVPVQEIAKSTPAHSSVEAVSGPAVEDFSTLDRVLIRTLVASTLDAENALSRVEAEALVDEFLAFCPERTRSWFHAGFLAALHGEQLDLVFAGANSDRRAWKMVGFLLGTARSQTPDLPRVLKGLAAAWSELLEPMAEGGRLEARRALLQLVPALIRAELWKPLSELLLHSPAPSRPIEMHRIYELTVEAACELISRAEHEKAIPLLKGMHHLINQEGASTDGNQLRLREVMRRLGQAHMRAGRFLAAIPILEQVVDGPQLPGTVNPTADLWLARAGLRSMSDFLPTENAAADRDRLAGLDDRTLIGAVQSARELGVDGAHAHLALGLLRFHQGRWKDADEHLSCALVGMMRIRGEYQGSGLLEHVRFLAGLSIAELGDARRVHEALAHLGAVDIAGGKYPTRLLEAWIRALTLVDETQRATELARQVIVRDPKRGWPLVEETDLTRANPQLRVEYADFLRKHPADPAASMRVFSGLLSHAVVDGEIREGQQLIDDMEGLARRSSPCAEQFAEILTRRHQQIADLWDEDSVDLSLSATLESLGRFAESAEILRRAFFRARNYASPERAEALLAGIEEVQVFDSQEIERLRTLLATNKHNPVPPNQELRGSVLFVGGNETQARYQQEILRHFNKSAPQLNLTLRFPGWSSNWIFEMEDIKRILPQFQVVVIHRFVRTQFGRALRAACGPATPWRACTGTGKQSLIAAIERAALWTSGRLA